MTVTRQRKSKSTGNKARASVNSDARPQALPEPFAGWFAGRGWKPRPQQLALIAASQARRSTLLIAPTGAGKTLAGFLPSLIYLAERPQEKRGAGR
jgi:ATP-dependent Lhr-like helicase